MLSSFPQVREKRRSLSLKGRESFQICRELEDKLAELECKLALLEGGSPDQPPAATPSSPSSPSPTPSLTGSTKGQRAERAERRRERGHAEQAADGGSSSGKDRVARLRRKSLDSATSSEPMKVLIRLSALESKVANAVRQAERQEPVRVSVEHDSVTEEAAPAVADTSAASGTPLARLRTLEGVVLRSRAKMRDCMRLLERASRAAADSASASASAPPAQALERSLVELEAVLREAGGAVLADGEAAEAAEARSAVQRLERLLQTKLRELAGRRQALRQAGKLDRCARLALLAEKLAYETVLAGRLQQACLGDAEAAERRQATELAEADRFMSVLAAKLGPSSSSSPLVTSSRDTSLDHLTRVVSRFVLLQASLAAPKKVDGGALTLPALPAAAMEGLLGRKRQLDAAVDNFRREKLAPLASLLAEATLRMDDDARDADAADSAGLDQALRLAQRAAQEAVNHELVQAEIAHVAERCARDYSNLLAAERDADLAAASVERAGLELWTDAAERALTSELDAAAKDLTNLYERCLAELRESPHRPAASTATELASAEEATHRLLMEWADITAYKALVDARVTTLCGASEPEERGPAELPSPDLDEALDADSEVDRIGVATSSAEFEFLFHKFCGECRTALGDTSEEEPAGCSGEVMWALSDIKDELNRLQDCIQVNVLSNLILVVF